MEHIEDENSNNCCHQNVDKTADIWGVTFSDSSNSGILIFKMTFPKQCNVEISIRIVK